MGRFEGGRARRRLRAPLRVVVPSVVALAAGTAVAVGDIPDSNGVIHGCYGNVAESQSESSTPYGVLRVIDPSLQGTEVSADAYQCLAGETPISWNQQGPPGAPGANGAQGIQGPPGEQGPRGPSAPSVSVQSGPGASLTMILTGTGLPGTPAVPKGAVELQKFSLESTNSVGIGSASGGAGAGKAKFVGFKVVKLVDASSVALFQYLTRGGHFKQVDIVVSREVKGKLEPAAVYRMAPVFLTSIKTASAGGAPTETIDGEFGALQFEVTPQSGNGTTGKPVAGSWNQVTNSSSIPGLSTGTLARRRR